MLHVTSHPSLIGIDPPPSPSLLLPPPPSPSLPLPPQVMCGDSEPAAVTVSEPYHVCSGLPADTPLSVMAWAVNGAGRGEMVTVETSTACQSEALLCVCGGGGGQWHIQD